MGNPPPQKKKNYPAKTAEQKIAQAEPWRENNRASAFYYGGPVIDFNKVVVQAVVYLKNTGITQSEKNIFVSQKLPKLFCSGCRARE